MQQLYDASMLNRKFVPVLLPGGESDDIPTVLRGVNWYEIPSSYSQLKGRLFDLASVIPQPLRLEVDADWSY